MRRLAAVVLLLVAVAVVIAVSSRASGQAPESAFLVGGNNGNPEPRLAGLQWRFVRVKYHANSIAGRRFRMQYWGDPWATDVSTGYSGNEAGALLFGTSQGVGALANVFAFGTVSAVGATTVTAAFTGTMPSASAFGGGNLWCNLLTLPRAPAKALIASATQTDSTHLQFTLSSAFSIAPQVGDVIAVG